MKIFQVIAVSVFDNEANILVRAFSDEKAADAFGLELSENGYWRDVNVVEMILDGEATDYIV